MPKPKSEIIDKLAIEGIKLTKREKLIPMLVVGVIVFTLIIFLRPIIGSIKENKEKLKENRSILDELKKERKTLEKISAEESEFILNRDFNNIEKYLPTNKVSLPVLLNLISLARMKSVKFSGVTLNPGKVKDQISDEESVKKVVKKDVLKNYEISISISGEQNRIFGFINSIKELAPIMKVEEINTSIKEDEVKQSILNANLKLIVYYYEMADVLSEEDSKFRFITEEEYALLNSFNDYLFADPNFQENYSGVYNVVVGVTNPFSQNR